MPTLAELVAHCDRRTRRADFKDYPGAFNGLQVANDTRVTKIGAAVDAGLEPFRAAAAAGVDFLITHHGLYWNMPRPLTGPLYEAVATLIRNNIALYSSHLPLDAHPEIGNNALLAAQLGLAPDQRLFFKESEPIGCAAPCGFSREELRERIARHYPRHTAIEYGSARPAKVAFCSGSGSGSMAELAAGGIDTLVTGELREEFFNTAQEQRLNLYLCGHYATETHGVRALAAELSKAFGLPWEFIGTANPL
ncbi:MAG: Nif3-like dinuclear metal center hexameric protein [Opitutaceae bacterium]|jgi:dinuclear metal center YbgI/SA1388 family protein|nr:Nif3-like dinuclear metal center hexameric protein [Opitutaceae bacterium]